MPLALIVALSENNVIGRTNSPMLWHLGDDLRRFKVLTTGHPVIMGHTTYTSIGQPLPDRTNIVVTNQQNLIIPGATVVHSPKEALLVARQKDDTVFVIGGAQLYRALLDRVDTLYITRVHTISQGDILFHPPSDIDEWRLDETADVAASEQNDYPFTWSTFHRDYRQR